MPRALEIAVRRATAERCVSVLVIPGDVALRRAPETPAPKPHGLVPARPTVTPPAETIERLAALLNQARSVTLLCGGGCEGAHDELLQLAETLKAPIVHALRGKEHVEWDNPYDVGMTGLIGFSSGYRAMESCDLLLMLGTDFPYRQFYPKDARVLRIELPIRKIRPQHEEQVAGFHRPISGREADQTGHADVVGIVPFDMLLATQGMDDRRLQGFGELQQFVMGALAAAAAQQSHAARLVEKGRQPLDRLGRRCDRRSGWDEAVGLRRRRLRRPPQRHVARNDQHADAALGRRATDSDLQRAWHLLGVGHELAIAAAFAEQLLGMSLLEVAAADLGRWDMRGNRHDRHA